MKIVVASPLQAGSQWAHALNTIKMADGFSKIGHDVTLITRTPDGRMLPKSELTSMYGIDDRIDWLQLPPSNLDWMQEKMERLHIEPFWKSMPFSGQAYKIAKALKPDLTYSRDFYFPWWCSKSGIDSAAESHAPPGSDSRRFKTLVKASHNRHFRMWVTISESLRDYYVEKGAQGSKIKVLPDAVDLSLFSRPNKPTYNPYDPGMTNIVYAGHLYDYKGIPTILAAAMELPKICFHLIGGWPEDVKRHRSFADAKGINNVTFHGLLKHVEVPRYLWHADILLLPPSARHPSAAWTSPIKLGEYLASGTPVICSDIPALRRWLTKDEVLFVVPDNADSTVSGINMLLEDQRLCSSLSACGVVKAQSLSYESRAAQICQVVEKH